MKKLLTVVALLGLATAFAVADDAPVLRTQQGVIVKVDGANLVQKFKVAPQTPMGHVREVTRTYVTNDKTVVTLDDKEAKLADLKADMPVTVTFTISPPAPGVMPTFTATKIEAKAVPTSAPAN